MLGWDSGYDVGLEKIDAEHRIFFELIVDFQVAATEGAPKEKLLRIMNFIVKYAEFHFASEEHLMMEFHYPEQSQHADLHHLLLDQVKNSVIQFQQDKLRMVDVSKFLLDWFVHHIEKEDKKLAGYIGKIG